MKNKPCRLSVSKVFSCLRVITLLLLACYLVPHAQPVGAQSEHGLVRASIILTVDNSPMPEPLVLQFDAAGGQAYGELELCWDTNDNGSCDLYFLLYFLGTYSGAAEGRLDGTIQGAFLAKGLADSLLALGTGTSYDDFFQDLTGTWEGTILLDGTGSGTWTYALAASPGGNVSAREARTYPWELVSLDTSEVVMAPIEPEPPTPVPPSEVPGDSAPAEQAEMPGDSAPPGQAEIPVGSMTGAAVAGTVLGIGLSQVLLQRRPSMAMAPSPATGKMVPAAQAQQEQARMDSGWVYRDGEGWVAPHGNTFDPSRPSILAREAEAARAQVRSDFERYTAERRAQLKQERIAEYREMAERHLQGTQEDLNRMMNSITVAEIGIETTYDVAAAVLIRRFPVKTIGRATWMVRALGRKYLAPAISEGYSQVKIVAKNIKSWAAGEETTFWQDQALHVATKPLDFIPGGRYVQPARALAEEAAKSGAGNYLQSILKKSLFIGQ